MQVVVVLSGSMEPAFYRGDILFLNKGSAPLRTGEIVVFNIDGRDIPIVHRVIKFHERRPGGKIDILTKVAMHKKLVMHACCPDPNICSTRLVVTAMILKAVAPEDVVNVMYK